MNSLKRVNVTSIIAPIKVPILEWLKEYTKELFIRDLIAGITVFVFLIPQGMAYALLAGMPPVYGLYSSTVPLYVYSIFGTSRQLSLGPMAITSLLIGVSCQTYGYTEASPDYIVLAISLSLVVGFITFFLGLFRLGSLANLISHSMLTGFVTASALVIALSQFKYLLGIHVPRFTYNHQTIIYMITHLYEINLNAILIGTLSFAFLYLVREWKKRNKKPPEALTARRIHAALSILANASNLLVIFTTGMIAKSILADNGSIAIIGVVPSGIQSPSYSIVSLDILIQLVPSAFAIAIVSFAGNWAVGMKYATENHYTVEATQELIATGLSTMVGIFFHGFVVSGGLARTAVNAESGAATQLSACITATFMIIALLFFTSYFYYIPMCALGAIIEVSILSMLDFEAMVKAYRIDKRDCLVMVITFLCTFFIGVSEGLFIGMFISMGVVMKTTAFPQIVVLGKLPDGHFRNITRFSSAEQIPAKAIIRMDASLYFANCVHFKNMILNAAKGDYHSTHDAIDTVIIDVSAWVDIDLKGIETLFEIRNELASRHIELLLACAKGMIRDRLINAKFIEHVQEFYMSIDDAVMKRPAYMSSTDLKAMEMVELGGSVQEHSEEDELSALHKAATVADGDRTPGKHAIRKGEYVVLSRVISEQSFHNPIHIASSSSSASIVGKDMIPIPTSTSHAALMTTPQLRRQTSASSMVIMKTSSQDTLVHDSYVYNTLNQSKDGIGNNNSNTMMNKPPPRGPPHYLIYEDDTIYYL